MNNELKYYVVNGSVYLSKEAADEAQRDYVERLKEERD